MYNARVEIIRERADARVIRVFPAAAKSRYRGGQYGSLGLASDSVLGKLVKRAYSISCSMIEPETGSLIDPETTDYYEFYFNKVSGHAGERERLTPKLFALKDGDEIYCGPKITGHYTLDEIPPGANLLLVASTTGEAANNSIVNQWFREERGGRVCSIIHGPVGWESLYREEHARLSKRHPSYRAIEMQDTGFKPLTELIDRCCAEPRLSVENFGFELSPGTSHIYLCGDPAMIGAPGKMGAWSYETAAGGVIPEIEKRGFSVKTKFKEGNISHEAYW